MSLFVERLRYAWGPVLFLLVGIAALALLESGHRHARVQLDHAVASADHLNRMRLHLAQSYLSAERVREGDPTFDAQAPHAHLRETEALLDDWMEARSSLAGFRVQSEPSPEVQALAAEYGELLRDFEASLATGGAVALRLAFTAADRKAEEIGSAVRAGLQDQIRAGERGHRLRVMGWGLLVLLGSLGLLVRGRARARAVLGRERSERRYRGIVETAPVGIARTSPDGRVLTANGEFARMLGYPDEESLVAEDPDLGVETYADPEDRRALIRTLERTGVVREREIRGRRRDGSAIWMRISAALEQVEGSAPTILAFVQDITKERSLEEQLVHSQKMEAVGALAGGMAHDFNNLLTPILVNADLALLELGQEHPVRRDLEEIRTATVRATELTRRILTFSRKEEFSPQTVELGALLRGMESLLARSLPGKVRLEFELEDAPCRVRIDRGRFEQVVLNLVVNARDAMPDGGVITIRTGEIQLDEAYAEDHLDVVPGRYSILEVSDTGHGMDAETRRKIFDPFFTTKPADRGTGLGLSTVYGVVTSAGGYVRVYSEPGRGTLFRVYLPCLDEVSNEPAEDPAILAGEAGGVDDRGGTVLIAEDDSTVRRAAARALEGRGHRVIEADSGTDALTLIENYPEPIDLLLTDIVLPGIDGIELAERARGIRPGLRIILTSGYTEGTVFRQSARIEGAAFIQKPFTAGQLTDRVRGILRGEE
jgi:two-component system, cell cycle sensor histidine kinase and response regulator CckA